ncbi:MAG: DUF1015 family protein [Saprospiraceae bacterium]
MHINPFQAIYPNFDMVASADSFFDSVKEEYQNFVNNGFFQPDSGKSIYICEISSHDRSHRGILATCAVSDFLDGYILKHENTLASREQQMITLILQRNAMIKPVLLTYPPVAEIQHLMNEWISAHQPFYQVHFENGNEWHTFWKIDNEASIAAISKLFEQKVPVTYIADGHHRTSSSAYMYEHLEGKPMQAAFSQIFSCFFDYDQLQVFDYNRIVELTTDWSPVTFMAKLSGFFEIEPIVLPEKPKQKHEISMVINNEWFMLRWRPEILRQHEDEPVILDVALLNQYVFETALEIKDVRTDERIRYIPGTAGLDAIRIRAAKNDQRVGFCLFPIDIRDVQAIADAGQVLPPKSTWFEPRIKNGLLIYPFETV